MIYLVGSVDLFADFNPKNGRKRYRFDTTILEPHASTMWNREPMIVTIYFLLVLCSSVVSSTAAKAVLGISILSASSPRWNKIRGGYSHAEAVDLSYDRLGTNAFDATEDDESRLENQIERTVQMQWQRHRRWARVARKRRRKVYLARTASLVLLVTGALVQQLPKSIPHSHLIKQVVGGASVGAVPLIKAKFLSESDVKKMAKSEWVSRSIEAEVFKFRARAMEYSYFKTNPQVALNALRRRCYEFTLKGRENDDLFDHTLPDDRPVPGPLHTSDEYIKSRIDKQVNGWYRRRARLYNRRYSLCVNCETSLVVVASAANLLKTFLPSLEKWYSALTTAAAAIGVHIVTQNYQRIAHDYNTAVIKLEYIKECWPPEAATSGTIAWEENVDKVESVIQSTIDDTARAKSGDENFLPKSSTSIEDGSSKAKKWDPKVVCGTDESGFYVAVDRMKWLMDNKSMSEQDAMNKVMEEYPENFS